MKRLSSHWESLNFAGFSYSQGHFLTSIRVIRCQTYVSLHLCSWVKNVLSNPFADLTASHVWLSQWFCDVALFNIWQSHAFSSVSLWFQFIITTFHFQGKNLLACDFFLRSAHVEINKTRWKARCWEYLREKKVLSTVELISLEPSRSNEMMKRARHASLSDWTRRWRNSFC